MSRRDSPLEKVPPADAVNSIKPHAARPDAIWKEVDFLESHTLFPRRQRTIRHPNAKPNPVIERKILLTNMGLFNPSPGAEERPLKIAKGVAANPNIRVK